jgi:hypothetical protein
MFESIYISNDNQILLEDIKGRISKVWSIIICDDDFEEDNIVVSADNISAAFLIATIKVYENKKLNVAFNLILCIKYLSSPFNTTSWSMSNQINFYATNIPEFAKYKNDLEKYMVLM